MALKLVSEDESRLDSRDVTPADVVDALKGAVDRGEANACIAISEDIEGNLTFICTDMTTTELIGMLEISKQNFIHGFQHSVSMADLEIES